MIFRQVVRFVYVLAREPLNRFKGFPIGNNNELGHPTICLSQHFHAEVSLGAFDLLDTRFIEIKVVLVGPGSASSAVPDTRNS